MTLATPLPTRVVVFASEQLFPALQFVLHAAATLGPALASLHIYCTADERRSGAPARRLQSIVQRWSRSRGQALDIHLTTGDMWPGDVRAGLTDWFEAAPASRWWVNVTGGTKPMSAAAIELTLATDLEARRVIYQELDGQWIELVVGDDGLLASQALDARTDPAVPPMNTLDRLLPVEDLVAAQFSEEHRITTQTVARLDVDAAVREVMARGWRWRDGLAALPQPTVSLNNGDAFERFLGAGLLDCGLALRHSLKVLDGQTDDRKAGKPVREVDLVGCHRGRLFLIDIKLPGAQDESKGTQLADIAEMAHSLGGRGALALAVRPGWTDDPDAHRLAKALGVRLLTQADAARVFTWLLGWIDPALTPSPAVHAAQAQLQAAHARGNDVLSNGRRVVAHATEHGTLHMPSEIERLCERRGEPWGLVELAPAQYWLCIPKKKWAVPSPPEAEGRLRHLYSALHERSADGTRFDFRDTAAWVYVQFTLRPGVKGAHLRDLIRQALTGSA